MFQVFSALPDEIEPDRVHELEEKVDKVCWEICSGHYLERDNPIFPDSCVYNIFRVFSMLGEMVENDDGKIEVRST